MWEAYTLSPSLDARLRLQGRLRQAPLATLAIATDSDSLPGDLTGYSRPVEGVSYSTVRNHLYENEEFVRILLSLSLSLFLSFVVSHIH